MLTPEARFSLISPDARKVIHQGCTYFVSDVPENAGFSFLDSKGRNGSTIRLFPDKVQQTIHSMDQRESDGRVKIFGHTSGMAEIFRVLYQELLDISSDR